MPFEKNKKNALLLSTLAVLSYSITSAILNMLLPYLLTGDIHTVVAHPENLSQPANLIGLILLTLVVFLVLTAIGAYWLYQFFGDKYFGRGSPIRWALFGFLFALLMKIPDWIFPEIDWILPTVFRIAGLFGAFFLARWIIPLPGRSGQSGLPETARKNG